MSLLFVCVGVQTVTLYLVKWCSLAYEDSTWELKADIDQSKIDEYERIASRTPNTKKVVSVCVCVRVRTLFGCYVTQPPPSRHLHVCVFVCVGLPPALSCRFTAPLMFSTGPRSCGLTHSHTPCSCGRSKPLTVCLMLNRSSLLAVVLPLHHSVLSLCPPI